MQLLAVRNVSSWIAFLVVVASYGAPCSAQAPPPATSVTYDQSAPVGGFVTETITVTGPGETATVSVFAYTVTGTLMTGYTYTPYGTPVALSPQYTTNPNGVQMWNGTLKGSGTLASGAGTKYILKTRQLIGGSWYDIASSNMFSP